MDTSSLLVQLPQAGELPYLIFPAALLIYYLICWLLVGRDSKIENVATQYDTPPGISPGVARYILTGGSDGTTLAAILADLAAKQVISVQPEGRSYRIKLLNDRATVMPEGATALKSLLGVELAACPYSVAVTAKSGITLQPPKPSTAIFGHNVLESSMGTTVPHSPPPPDETVAPPRRETILNPSAAQDIKSILDAIQATFREKLKGVYFRWNFGFVGAGMMATFVWALVVAWTLKDSPLFLTFWLLFFTSVAGLVIAGVWTSKPAHPTPAQRIQYLLVPILFFLLPGFVIYVALPNAHTFVLALLISVVLNNIFFVLMRAPTAEGRRVLQQLAGFREFLVRVEQDRLSRLNSQAEQVQLMNRFLPYAIALNVREGWGDSLAAAFSNAVVER